MADCSKCAHAIYDEIDGECECEFLGYSFYNTEAHSDCEFYDEKGYEYGDDDN